MEGQSLPCEGKFKRGKFIPFKQEQTISWIFIGFDQAAAENVTKQLGLKTETAKKFYHEIWTPTLHEIWFEYI